MSERVYEIDLAEKGKLDAVLKADPYAEVSFAKQGYKLKEGRAVGGEGNKIYLYIKAEEGFFRHAEAKMKDGGVASCRRCGAELESRIISQIHEEDSSAEQGFGAIFG